MSRLLREDRFTQVVFAVLVVLIGTGVTGVWSMSNALSRLDERVQVWTTVYAGRIDTVVRDQRDSDRRIGALEGSIPSRR